MDYYSFKLGLSFSPLDQSEIVSRLHGMLKNTGARFELASSGF